MPFTECQDNGLEADFVTKILFTSSGSCFTDGVCVFFRTVN